MPHTREHMGNTNFIYIYMNMKLGGGGEVGMDLGRFREKSRRVNVIKTHCKHV